MLIEEHLQRAISPSSRSVGKKLPFKMVHSPRRENRHHVVDNDLLELPRSLSSTSHPPESSVEIISQTYSSAGGGRGAKCVWPMSQMAFARAARDLRRHLAL